GVEVEAYLVAPPAVRDAPAIVYARGGGRHAEINPYLIATHLAPLAAAGFCVVATQYRNGSTDGDEFGGADVADLVNVAAVLQQLPEADPARAGLVGWSRGAMMVHLALAHAPSAFRAAVCAAGAGDLFAELQRRPEMETVYAEQIPEFEAHRERELSRRSPLLWADRLPRDVPILLLHGAADWRVSPHESLRLAARLLELAIPSRLVLYEGGEHGIREHADEVVAEITTWFRRYLETGAALPNVEPHGP
ncbi:MAG: prolyl oligopeptidase family serine peptidase, partial [Myxococcota bacterium]